MAGPQTYSELIDEIIDTAADNLITEARVRRFIAYCEQDLNNNKHFRIVDMQNVATSFITEDDPYITLPDLFLDMEYLRSNVNFDEPPLTYVAPRKLVEDRPNAEPLTEFTIIAGQIRVRPSPGMNDELEMAYYSRIPPLSDANTSNWLLLKHPTIYLYGALKHTEAFLTNDARIPVWQGLYDSNVDDLIQANKKTKTTRGTTIVQMHERVS